MNPPNRIDSRLLAIVVIGVAAAVVLPFGATLLGPHPGFLPAFFTAILAADLATAFLLYHQFRSTGNTRFLGLAAAYLWCVSIVVPHALVFPGVVTATGLLGADPSSAPWLWTVWHTGFPVLLALAVAPWPRPLTTTVPPRRRTVAAAGVIAATLALAGAVVWLTTGGVHLLPQIIAQGDYSYLTDHQGPYIIAANLVALLVVTLSSQRGRLERWVLVAAAASFADVILVLLSEARFTAGWYAARGMSLVAATVVLGALLAEITRLYRQLADRHAELSATYVELAESERVREHLVAVTTHELKNPLMSITGFADLLLDEVSTPAGREYAQAVVDQGARMTGLVEEVLTVSAAESGALTVNPEPVRLRGELDRIVAGFPDQGVEVDCPPDLVVLADPQRLHQMVDNYLTNAVKYGRPPIRITATRDGEHARLEVRNAGDPVSAEFVPRLFETFARAPEAIRSAVRGTGLGLSVVRGLARAQGGDAWHEPRPDGAAFLLSLPVTAGS
jgi:signal transduction histidine kinase